MVSAASQAAQWQMSRFYYCRTWSMSVRIQRTIACQNRFSSLGEHLSEPKKRFYFIYIVDFWAKKSSHLLHKILGARTLKSIVYYYENGDGTWSPCFWHFSLKHRPYSCIFVVFICENHNNILIWGRFDKVEFWPYLLAFKAMAPENLCSRVGNIFGSKVFYIYLHDIPKCRGS
jgi:hypothetical protein